MKKLQSPASRRGFLLAAVSGGAAGAAAVLIGASPSPPDRSKTPAKTASTGYQLTEHVRNYYRTAKI